MYRIVNAVEEVIRVADSAKRQAFAQTKTPWLIQRSRRSSGLFSGVVMARSREQDVTISVP